MTQTRQTKKSRSPWQKASDWAHIYYGEEAAKVSVKTGLESIGRWYELGRVIYTAEVYDKDGEELDIDPMLPVFQAFFEDDYHGQLLAAYSPQQALDYFKEVAREQATEQLVARDATYDLTKPPKLRKKPVTEII